MLRPLTLAAALAFAPAPHAQAQDTAMSPEIALFLTIKTQPGKRDELVGLWDDHLRQRAADNPDQARYVMSLDMADPDIIRIAEVYATKAGFEANSQAPWFAEYMEAAGPLLAGQPEFYMAQPHWVK